MNDDWRDDALCSQVGGDWWFPEKGGDNGTDAKTVCARCPVVVDCREFAVETWQAYGVWGGMSPKQLAAIRHERGMRHPLLSRPESAA